MPIFYLKFLVQLTNCLVLLVNRPAFLVPCESPINDLKLATIIGKKALANYSTCGGNLGSWTYLSRLCKAGNNYFGSGHCNMVNHTTVYPVSLELGNTDWLLALANMGCVQTL